jgi:membrane-bound lytic murein transglycosylase MltF
VRRNHMKTLFTIGRLTFLIAISLVIVASAFAQPSAQAQASPESKQKVRKLDITKQSRTGDFDKMLEWRVIRVRVPFSRSLYFNSKGREMGFAAETVRDFEQWINKKYAKKLGKRPLTVMIIPTTRDKLFTELSQGFGEIAVGNLTITDERLKTVDFVSAEGLSKMVSNVKELVVTGPKSPPIASTDDLAGKTVHVRKSSSYFESLNALNERFKKDSKPAMKLVLVPDALEDEDLMEMVNAGILQYIVVYDYMAKMWAPILPKIKINEQVAVREGAKMGWAIPKGCPKLAAEINDFYIHYMKKQGVFAYRFKKYISRVKQISDATGKSEMKRFEETLAIFQKYGEKYNFDPLMLAAQGFQESKLDQKARSHRGAVGVMQLMPATGKELKVGDITVVESNIHAGSKYMDQLMTRYFKDANFKGNNRTLFAFACYNCGPGNVSKMRKEAARRGYDPDEWFNNVEIVTAEKIGIETTTYVRNIFKYYVAYKLEFETREAARKAREQLAPATSK